MTYICIYKLLVYIKIPNKNFKTFCFQVGEMTRSMWKMSIQHGSNYKYAEISYLKFKEKNDYH